MDVRRFCAPLLIGLVACFDPSAPGRDVTIDFVTPFGGPVAGGTAIDIHGGNFIDVTGVTIGGEELQDLMVVDRFRIAGTTPAGEGRGAVNVVVNSSRFRDDLCKDCFTYHTYNTVNWTLLTAGEGQTCGQTSGGATFCWGRIGLGALVGDFGDPVRYTPVAVGGGIAFSGVSAGQGHACGVTGAGIAYCWGGNLFGELGDGTTTIRATPVPVAGGLTFARVIAKFLGTCGLTTGGAAHCWGANFYGALGDSSTTQRSAPVAVKGGLLFVDLTLGRDHACGLTGGGAAYCWGSNSDGELGDSSTSLVRYTPVAVVGGVTFSSLTAGWGHTCGLTSGGSAYCWGYNLSGQLGDGSATSRSSPSLVSGGHTFTSLTAGMFHTCGVTTGGASHCWGNNSQGALGDGSTIDRNTPVAVTGGLIFVSLTAGWNTTCGRTSGGAAYCWGDHGNGALGDGSGITRTAPSAVADPD